MVKGNLPSLAEFPGRQIPRLAGGSFDRPRSRHASLGIGPGTRPGTRQSSSTRARSNALTATKLTTASQGTSEARVRFLPRRLWRGCRDANAAQVEAWSWHGRTSSGAEPKSPLQGKARRGLDLGGPSREVPNVPWVRSSTRSLRPALEGGRGTRGNPAEPGDHCLC